MNLFLHPIYLRKSKQLIIISEVTQNLFPMGILGVILRYEYQA